MTTHHVSRSTGKERDVETAGISGADGLDYLGARYYGSNMGRFLSPDVDEIAEPLPYADLEDPQTLNLYSYVRNNPLTLIDPDGHMKCHPKPGDPETIVCDPDPPPAKKNPSNPPAQANTLPLFWPIMRTGAVTISAGARIAGTIGVVLGYLISPPYQYAKDTIDESDTHSEPNPENLTDKIGKIAEKTGRTAKEIRKAIHEVKKSLPRTGPVRNPDVTVDVTTGEVYPKTPGGGIGDSIGNIFDHLKDVGGKTP